MHLADWQIEPWGDYRTELAAAIVASTIANVHRAKDAKPFSPADFMPVTYPPAAPEAVADGAAALDNLRLMGMM